ncbi:hypothetical protein TNCV_3617171 [Trichonephila clavipes]|nr:hypothetical protein TNCV_3617171 [Trichonephila clavipes]
MATGSYLTPNYSRSQNRSRHKIREVIESKWKPINEPEIKNHTPSTKHYGGIPFVWGCMSSAIAGNISLIDEKN